MAQAHHFPTREELVRSTATPVSRTVKLVCAVLAVVGLLAFVAGLFVDAKRAWMSLHFNWLFLTSISTAAVAFVAVQRIVTARWSRPVVRFLEGYVAWLPVAWVILLLLVTLGQDSIFTWTHETPPFHEKQVYFQPGFFLARVIGAFTLVTVLALWYIYTCLRLDVGHLPEAGAGWARGLRERMRRGFGEERRELHSTHSLQGKLAVVYALVFAFGSISLSWDLSMSLSLHFQSTMYAWQFFMGGWVVMLMTWNVITRAWDRHLHLNHLVTESTYHDLGKLCFAFSAFWGYLTFGQYLIIWYGNLPEETHWFNLRLMQPWIGIMTAVFILMFVIPFFGLMGKKPKLWAPWMIGVAICSTIGLWLHRFIETYPSVYGEIDHLPFGIWEIGVALGMVGLWGLCYTAFMDAFPRLRVTLMTSPYRDEVQVPVDPRTMEPLPAHE